MSLLNGNSVKAKEILDYCMASESPELRAKVWEIVSLSGLEPNDPMFLTLLLTGQMRVLLEAAPEKLNRLLSEWKKESADSLSEIDSTIYRVKKTQIEQAEAIKGNMEAVSNKCVSDIKDAGMSTVGAIADASSENFERLQENQKQSEELFKRLTALQAETKAEREKQSENMNALIGWVNKTTEQLKLARQQIRDSHSELKLLQQKTFWLKLADWVTPLWALTIVGGVCFVAGGWLTYQKYNKSADLLGRNLIEWNLDRIVHCQKTDNPKCTVWIVHPDSPKRNK